MDKVKQSTATLDFMGYKLQRTMDGRHEHMSSYVLQVAEQCFDLILPVLQNVRLAVIQIFVRIKHNNNSFGRGIALYQYSLGSRDLVPYVEFKR